MAVIAAPILVVYKPEWVPILITCLALVLSLMNTFNQREFLQLKELSLPFIARIPGTVFGAWLLTQLSTFWLQVCVATCVLLAVIVSGSGKQFQYTPARLSMAAFVSGITGTTTSIGGPPMALVMQHGHPASVRANLSAYFTYSCTISLVAYAYLGLITPALIHDLISFLPVCLAGFLAGVKSRDYVDAGRFRPLILLLCGVSAIIALAGAVFS